MNLPGVHHTFGSKPASVLSLCPRWTSRTYRQNCGGNVTAQSIEGRFLGSRPPYGYQLVDLDPHPNTGKAAAGQRQHGLAPDRDCQTNGVNDIGVTWCRWGRCGLRR